MPDFEDFTPREQAEVKAERAVRDAWLAVTEACNLFDDPIARPILEREIDDIDSAHTKLMRLLTKLGIDVDLKTKLFLSTNVRKEAA